MESFQDITLAFAENHDFQSCSALLPEKIEEIHHIAFYLYQDQQYDKAIHFFRLLTTINPLETKYWKGLGASLQLSNKYEEAIESYISAILLSPIKPDPYLYIHAADCYFALNRVKQGLKALDGARASAKEQKNTQVVNHTLLMQELWSKKSK